MINALALVLSCSCGPSEYYPKPGTVNVPTNVVISALRLNKSEMISLLRDTDGANVDLVETNGRPLDSYAPTKSLTPRTKYRVMEGATEVTSFTTGDVADTTAPTTPTLGSVAYVYTPQQDTCEARARWSLVIEDGDDDSASNENLLVLAFAESGEAPLGFTTRDRPELKTDCPGKFTPPGTAKLELQVRVMDLAGNISAPSNGVATTGSLQPLSGCTAAPGELLVVLGILLAARRIRLKFQPVE